MSENLFSSQTTEPLPDGFWLRPAEQDDLMAITKLIQAVDLSDLGESDFDEKELLEGWQRPRFNLAEDAWVVETLSEQGQRLLVGYEELWTRPSIARMDGDGYVHPDYRGLGIGTALLRRLEQRALALLPLSDSGLRAYVRNGMEANDTAGRELHENEGYQPVRYFYRMQIDLKSEPEEPFLPPGIQLRPFQPGQEHLAFATLEDAFRDHWGFTPWSFTDWSSLTVGQEDFDPALFLLAWDGDQLAGAALCRRRIEGGWVSQLGVRKPWRRLGLGMALLKKSFREFYRIGVQQVALGVDAASTTGATRLYERAGMHVQHEFVVYEKELRPGKEPQLD